jgi:hypothetical protein
MIQRKLALPWTLLKEPKFISAMWGVVYSIYALNGIVFVLYTPPDLIYRPGQPVTFLTGGLLIVGGILATLSLHGGQWYMERAGIIFGSFGMIGYVISVWFFDDSLSEKFIRTLFSIGLMCATFARFYKIKGLTLDPSK